MLISVFPKNRLSFWKNRFFFDYRISVSLPRMPRTALATDNSAVCCLARWNAPPPTRKLLVSCPAWWRKFVAELIAWSGDNTCLYWQVVGVAQCFLSLPAISERIKQASVQRNRVDVGLHESTEPTADWARGMSLFIRQSIKFEWLKWT